MSFRVKLTALIAAVFVVGGAVLLAVQFRLVQYLLEGQVYEQTELHETPVEGAGALIPNPCPPNSVARVAIPPGTVHVLTESPRLEHHFRDAVTERERMTTHEFWEGPAPNEWIELGVTSAGRTFVVCVSADGQTIDRMAITDLPELPTGTLSQVIHETTRRITTQVSDEVLHSLLVWSLAMLAGFGLLAVLAAWWLSKRSLGRIAQITTAANEITQNDLHKRLALDGPDDEIKVLGDTIDAMLDRIQDAFTRQERFIAGASHELRTPLTTTRTLLEIPLNQGRIPKDSQPQIQGALRANARSERLITALLTLARSRSRRGELNAVTPTADVEPTDLTELTSDLLDVRLSAAQEAEVEFERLPATGEHVIAAADHGLLELAVGNLLDNAIAHNRPGGRAGVRVVRDPFEPGKAVVEVWNDGADLTAVDLEALKEPFHRGTQSRLAGAGLGLGLALVETVAETLGGNLTLLAREPGGLLARLSVPALSR